MRERVAAAFAEPGATQTAVAARFCVSVLFVEKLLQRQRASGSVAARPHRSGPAPLLGAAARAELMACLRKQPDATLDELRVWMAALGGPAVSVATAAAGATTLSYVDPLALNATAYYYAANTEADGDQIITSPIWYTRRIVTNTASSTEVLALAIFPNPTTGPATVSYYLAAASTVQVDVFDAVGRRVVNLAGEFQGAGPTHAGSASSSLGTLYRAYDARGHSAVPQDGRESLTPLLRACPYPNLFKRFG